MDKIVNKASKRIYLLKQLKRFGLNAGDLKCFYVASIRSILEYSCQVFHYGLPEYLSDVIERTQSTHLPSIIISGRLIRAGIANFIFTET